METLRITPCVPLPETSVERQVPLGEPAEGDPFAEAAALVAERDRAVAREVYCLLRAFLLECARPEMRRFARCAPAEDRSDDVWEQCRVRAAWTTAARWAVLSDATTTATFHRLKSAVQVFENLPRTAEALLSGAVSWREGVAARTREAAAVVRAAGPPAVECPRVSAGV